METLAKTEYFTIGDVVYEVSDCDKATATEYAEAVASNPYGSSIGAILPEGVTDGRD